jgi:hypothetical protein
MQERSILMRRAISTVMAERCRRGYCISLIRAPWLTIVLTTSADTRVVDVAVALNDTSSAPGQISRDTSHSRQSCGGGTCRGHTDCDIPWPRQ